MIALLLHRFRTTVLLFGLMAAIPGFAATITSNSSGNWNSTSTWVGNVVPTASDNVVIANNHNVTVNLSAPLFADITVNSGGQLLFNFVGTIFIPGDIQNDGNITMVNGLLTGNGVNRTITTGASGTITLDFTTFDPTIAIVNNGFFIKRGLNNTFIDFPGSFTNEASGTVQVNATKALGFSGTFINNGTVYPINDASLRFVGANMTLNAGSSIAQTPHANGNLSFGGTVNVSGTADLIIDIPNVDHGLAVLNGSGVAMIVESGVNYAMPNGWISGFTSLTNNGNMILSGVVQKRITIDVTNNASFSFTDGGLTTNGPATTFTNTTTGTTYLDGGNIDHISFVNQGTINLGDGQAISTDFENQSGASVVILSGQSHNFSANLLNNGTINLGGTLDVSGVLSGTGSIAGATGTSVIGSTGVLTPGQSPGCISFANDYTQNGTLTIEINGTTACSDYDQITVGGAASLGATSTLDVAFLGYQPSTNDEFTIIDAGAISGTFLSDNLPANWNIQYDYPNNGEVTLQYTGPGPGTACDNLAGTPPATSIAAGNLWGQTYIPTVACEGTNDQFESITLERAGNGTATYNLEIYDGATVSGTPKYTVSGLTTSQSGGNPTWDLSGGTGDRSFVIGQTYTFLFTAVGGSGVSIRTSGDVTSGQAIENGSFLPSTDLRFAVNSSSSAPAALDFNVDTKTAGPTNTVVIPVWVNNFNGVVNYQGTVNFDPNVLTFVQATSPQAAASPMIMNSFGTPGQGSIPNSAITFFWYDILSVPQTVPDGTFVIDLEFTVNANATTGFTPITIDGAVTPLGYSDDPNAINLLTPTVMNGGVNIDADPPVTQTVTISSNNALDQTLATVGDVITITFTTDEAPAVTPVVIINGGGNNSVIVTGSGTSWTATKVVQAGDDGLVTFDIELEDQYGNTSNTTTTSDNSSVTVDTQGPTITCPTIPALTSDAGQCGAVATFADATATDPSGATVSQIVGAASGTQFPVGTTTLTFQAIDGAGNISTCDVDVVVTDVTGPTVLTQNITVQLDATGNATINPSQIDNGSSDPCGLDATTPLALDITSFDCSDVGANTVTLTVKDIYGNTSTGTATVTVEDNVAPTVLTQDITVYLDATGNVSITPLDVDNGSNDACGLDATTPLSLDITSFDCSMTGANTVTLTVLDVNGNSNTGTATVTVVDNIAPTIVCPGDQTIDTDAGLCTATLPDFTGLATVTDNCGVSGSSGSTTSAYSIAAGYKHTVAIAADGTLWTWGEDLNGKLGNGPGVSYQFSPDQISTDTDWIAVTAAVGHSVALKSDGTLWSWGSNFSGQLGIGNNTDQESPVQVGTDTDWAYITSGNSTSLAIKSNGTLWAWGSNNLGQLGIGNTTDQTSPVQVGSDNDWIQVQGGLNHSIAMKSDGTIWTWGNNYYGQLGTPGNHTSPVQVGSANDWVAVEAGYYHSVALKADGTLWTWGSNQQGQLGIGNTTQQNSPVQVGSDTDWAVLGIQYTGTYAIKTNGSLWAWGARIYGAIGDGVTSGLQTTPKQVGTSTNWTSLADGTSNFSTLALQSDGSLFGWGFNNQAQLGLGNATFQPTPVQVPAFTVSQPINSGGSGSGFAVTQSPAAGTALAVGTHTITLSTQDASGNPASCTFQVTVEDNEAPTVLTQDITVQLDASGNATILPSQIDNGSSDPCGLDPVTPFALDITTFDCSNVGTPVTVTLTVKDVNGNTNTGTAIVTVEDNVKPTVVTQDITVQLDATGNASITPAMINNGSSDACGLHPTTPLALDITAFDCSNVGNPVTVTLTVTDVNGNTETGTAVVTVEDNVKPTVLTQDITVTITGDGTVTITPAQIDNGSNDACGLDGTTPFALDISTFGCNDVGNPVTVTLTVLDANGNSETGTAVVTVVLAQNASIDGQAITEDNKVIGGVTFDAAGTDGASSQLGTPGYSFLMTPCIGVNDIGAFKNNDANVRNGIDVSDITAMTQHILNIQALGSPYKLLAADVNHNGLINGPDVSQLRQMILAIRDGFPTPGATSSNPNTDDYLWTFIPTDHTWTDNTNPWVYPTRRFFNAPTNSTGEDFYGVKLGDVNNTWDETNPLTGGFADTLTMLMSDAIVQPGAVFTVPVMLKDFKDISGYQYTLNWDPSVLQLESVENSQLFGFFNTDYADQGVLSTVWNDMAGQAITESDNTVAFELTFRAVGGWASSSELTITSDLTNSIAYDVEETPMIVVAAPVRIAVGESTTSIDPAELEGFALLQNVPNPFETATTFSFSLPRQEEVTVEVYNALGQIVKTFSGTYGVGTHELDWNGANDAGTEVAEGIYYVKMKAGAFNASISVRKGL